MIQLVLGSLHHFCKNIFSGTLSSKRRFSGNFKTSILNQFSWVFFTCLFSIDSQLLINIYYLQYWFLKNEQGIMFKTFQNFQNIPSKYSSFYTRLEFILKRLYRKVIQQSFYWRNGIFEIVVTNRNGHKNVQ